MEPRIASLERQNGDAVPADFLNDATNGSHPRFRGTTNVYAHELYSEIIPSQDAEAFLAENDQYHTTEKKWSFSAMSGATDPLIGSVYNVLRSIVGRFVRPEQAGVEREVKNTLNISSCQRINEDGLRVCPVLLVRASGPSFQIPEGFDSSAPASSCFGFSNMTTYFSVKLESEVGTEKEILDEMSSYARRIFREQPNRIFVRSLFLTEQHARLVHFDRSGSQITPPIDIHQHPVTLIRIVAGLSSTNERLLGLDDSVQWKIVDGRKTEGSLTTIGPTGEWTTYPVLGQMATNRDSIRGRATTCWRVRDPVTSEEYVIKDSWRPDDRTAEHEFLQLVKGVPGVAQMISCEPARGGTKDFRCPSTIGQYHNRVFGRITMRSYGKLLMHFTSVLQLLCALRDAIAAHQKLVGDDLRILHRDISPNNVLLGKESAPEGERGIIIDFDMAFQATDDIPKVTADHNIGTRLTQSTPVLGTCYPRRERPAHDYLDDLESFLYLLTFVFLSYRPDGSRFSRTELGPSIVKAWADEDAESAYISKRGLYGAGAEADSILGFIDEHWGSCCSALFDAFSWWILDREGDKSDLLIGPDATGAPDALEPLFARRDEHYAEVLKMFDEAIEAINESASEKTNAYPPSPANPGPAGEKDNSPAPQGAPDSAALPHSAAPTVPSTQPAADPPPSDDAFQDVEMEPPTAQTALPKHPTPAPPSPVTQPRRSIRIRNLLLAKAGNPLSLQVNAPQQKPVPAACSPASQPRRSSRIRKRRLEDDEPSESAPPRTKPVKKRARISTRSR